MVGDVVTAVMGAWIVWEARNLGMSKFKLLRMAANVGVDTAIGAIPFRSEEHTSELQSLMRISYAVFCLKKKNTDAIVLTAITYKLRTNKLVTPKHNISLLVRMQININR